jgi:SHS2 domain-containing protein
MHHRYDVIAHTADIQLKFYGSSQKELFENALFGMFDYIKPHYSSQEIQSYPIHIRAQNIELLLVDFLSQALYLSDVYNVAFSSTRISTLHPTEIIAQLSGSTIDGFAVAEIKAVTYHDLSVKKVNNHWEALIVFDI